MIPRSLLRGRSLNIFRMQQNPLPGICSLSSFPYWSWIFFVPYALHLPPKRTGKRGRPKKYGERLSPEDFVLESPKTGDWKTDVRPVLIRLWGERMVYAIVTLPKSENGSRRLFFCAKNPESIILDYSRSEDDTIRRYEKENKQFLTLACYSLRWNIEISYYEIKTFWSLEEYRVRSREGIEHLVNLECIAYSAMTLLPYSGKSFSCYRSASAQETRIWHWAANTGKYNI